MIKNFILGIIGVLLIASAISSGSLEPIVFGVLMVGAYHTIFANMGEQPTYDPCDNYPQDFS